MSTLGLVVFLPRPMAMAGHLESIPKYPRFTVPGVPALGLLLPHPHKDWTLVATAKQMDEASSVSKTGSPCMQQALQKPHAIKFLLLC